MRGIGLRQQDSALSCVASCSPHCDDPSGTDGIVVASDLLQGL